MRTCCKKITSLFAALLLALLLTVPAFAASDSETRFSDVPADSPWFESVEYIAERGITVGTGEGRYSPDASITVRQWAVMLCRAYDKTEALEAADDEFGKVCLAESYCSGWLSVEAVTEPDTRMCRGALYQSAFAVIGLPVYDYTLYPDGKILTPYENCLRIGAELGLCPEDTDPYEIVSRGETAALLHSVLTQEFEIDEPPVLTEFPIESREDLNMNDYLLELQRVPEPLLWEFQRRGWVYTVDFDYLVDLSKRYEMSCIGAANYSEKRIYVSEARATLHEFGHFLDGVLGFPSMSTSFYADESQAAAVFLRDYSLTNCREYFADYFVHWLCYHDNEEKAAQMRERTPKTYQYFCEVAERNWGVSVISPESGLAKAAK